MNLIDQVQFDTIYHEHFFYLSLFTVEKIFAVAGLRVFEVELLPTHGGSLRIFACHRDAAHAETEHVKDLRARERERRLDRLEGYTGFPQRVAKVREEFLAFLARAEAEGKIVAGYGAAAKGATFLNYCGVKYPRLREIYDRAEFKQGKLAPGSHAPIVPIEQIDRTRPDYLVILPWNIAEEVRRNMSHIGTWGGRFVVAIPHTQVCEPG